MQRIATSSTCYTWPRDRIGSHRDHAEGTMKRIVVSAAALLAGLGACAPVVSTTPVHGDAIAISRLDGEWNGEYSSTETGRSGAIYFRLRAGADTAEGDVIMSPSQGASANVAEGRTAPTPPSGAPEPVLTIRFVA